MKTATLNLRSFAVAGVVLAAAASRLFPHPPNVTPIAAIALFGGAKFADKRLAFVVPLAALLLSDLALGMYPGMAFVYGSFALTAVLGLSLRSRPSAPRIALTALAGSVLFFAITNFGVWVLGRWYPTTGSGLTACYFAAIPFFRNSLVGDLIYTAVLFGGFALAERRWPTLRPVAPAA